MKESLKENWFTILAGLMLLLAIPSDLWSYSYYQLLRWVVMIVAAYSAYSAYKTKNTKWIYIMGAIAILFNPIAPIFLEKGTWQILDFITAVTFFISLKK